MIKGDKVDLIPATLNDRKKVYEWCFQSETTKCHTGLPDYPQKPVVNYDEFCADYYEEYFFTGAKIKEGRGFIISSDNKSIGFISYSCFHLKPSLAEIDIWLNCEVDCNKGLGSAAIILLSDYLDKILGISELIIAPSIKNIRAIKSYEKAGFKKTKKIMNDFLLDEYVSLYGTGDYGIADTIILVKQL